MRVLFCLLFSILLLSEPARADVGQSSDRLGEITAKLQKIDAAVDEQQADDDALVALRVQLEPLTKDLIALAVSLRPRLTDINKRLEDLGPPPKADDPPEPPETASERRALIQEKAQINAILGEAEMISIRSSKTVDRISALRRELFARTLFRQTDIGVVLDPKSATAFRREISLVGQQVSSRVKFMYNFRGQSLALALGLSLVFGVATAWGIRRLLRVNPLTLHDSAEDSYIRRLSNAFWTTVIPALATAASLAVAYGLLSYFGVFTEQLRALTEAFLISVAAIYFIQRLAGAIFSPWHRERRLIPVTDSAALVLFMLSLAIAVVQVADFFFGRVNSIFASPLSLTVAKSFISSITISLLMIMVAIAKPFTDEQTGARREWPAWIRTPLLLIALFIVVAALSGYVGLARFTSAQVVVTGAILATMFIGVQSGQILAAEGAFPNSALGRKVKDWFSISDAALDQLGLLLSFLVYFIVLAIGLPLILLQWGFNQLDIRTWLYKVFTDITIGTVSISLVGILFGILLFALGFLLTRRFQFWLDRTVMARSRVDPGVRNSIRTVVGYLGVALAGVIGLSAAGFNLSNLAIVAGALSLGIGFGLQNVVNNFVSGLILLAERPFKVGDWIETGKASGLVKKISVRATEIETFQHQTVTLPNSELINSAVGNWTHRNNWGRVDIPVTVPAGPNPRQIYDLLLEIGRKDPAVLKNPAPSAIYRGVTGPLMDFELRVHIPEVFDSSVVATRIRFEIHDALELAGIPPVAVTKSAADLSLAELERLSAALDLVRSKPRTRPRKG